MEKACSPTIYLVENLQMSSYGSLASWKAVLGRVLSPEAQARIIPVGVQLWDPSLR